MCTLSYYVAKMPASLPLIVLLIHGDSVCVCEPGNKDSIVDTFCLDNNSHRYTTWHTCWWIETRYNGVNIWTLSYLTYYCRKLKPLLWQVVVHVLRVIRCQKFGSSSVSVVSRYALRRVSLLIWWSTVLCLKLQVSTKQALCWHTALDKLNNI